MPCSSPMAASCASRRAVRGVRHARVPDTGGLPALRGWHGRDRRCRAPDRVERDRAALAPEVAVRRGPDEFEPFAVGYVDLGPVRVESPARRATAPTAWRIGDAVQLVAGQPDDDGDIWSYRFVPERRRRMTVADRRRRPAPVRALRHQRPRDGADRSPRARSPTPASRGATSSSPPAVAATAATRRRSSASSG